jgi:hypothetical protein
VVGHTRLRLGREQALRPADQQRLGGLARRAGVRRVDHHVDARHRGSQALARGQVDRVRGGVP